MKMKLTALLLLPLAACTPAQNESTPAPAPAPAPVSSPQPSPAPAAPVQAPSPPPAAEPPAATPDKSPEGALAVANSYFGLLRRGEYAKAWTVWPGPDSGVSRNAFVARYAKYSAYDAKLGEPGPMEGAAGSIYIEIPMVVSAKLKSGESEQLVGAVAMRRVNDVDGSTLAQRTWHINSVDLTPRP